MIILLYWYLLIGNEDWMVGFIFLFFIFIFNFLFIYFFEFSVYLRAFVFFIECILLWWKFLNDCTCHQRNLHMENNESHVGILYN